MANDISILLLDPVLSEPVLESTFSARLRSFEKVSGPLSDHTLSQHSDSDEIPDESEPAAEFQLRNLDHFGSGKMK